MKKILSSTLILVAITLIAGIALATVYEITKDPIAAAEEAARQEAYRMVMPDADVFEEQELKADAIEPPAGVRIDACLLASAYFDRDDLLSSVIIKPEDTDTDTTDDILLSIGYVVNVTSSNGYGGDITIAVGIKRYDNRTEIKGISVISQSETAGLGATCVEKSFTDQFTGISDHVKYTKTGKTDPHEIDAISGATITTKAITEAVNAALTYITEVYGAGGNN